MESPEKLLSNSVYGLRVSEFEKLVTNSVYGESTAIQASWYAEKERLAWESITDGGEIAL